MSQRVLSFAVLLAASFSFILFSCREPAAAEPDNRLDESKWQEIFSCQFESPEDLKKWNLIRRSINANNELQYYKPEACWVKDGMLYIRGAKEESKYKGNPRHYSSALLDTKNKFAVKYGRFDIRFKVPKGKGYWPAFWLLPASGTWPPEIDWMEILGHDTKNLLVTNHYGKHIKGNHPSKGTEFKRDDIDFGADFHTLQGIWSKGEILCFVDGKKVAESHEGVPDQKMYMILNLAIGGDLPGNPTDETVFPGDFVVDYVKVFAKKES